MMESRQDDYGNKSHGNCQMLCVSVIVPVYNVAPYLREALDSVVGQSYHNLEIIIVDDGSTDGSSEICDEYRSDLRVRVIHQENRGLSNARNVGLDVSSGMYIAFLDSDDAFHPDFIQKMVYEIGDADVAVCRYEVHHSTLASREQIFPRAKEGVYSREEALRALVDGRINNPVWNKLYRREMWEQIRFPNGHNYEDIDTTYRIFDRSNLVTVIGETLYFYRRRRGSITQTGSKENIEDRNRAWDHLAAFVEANIPKIFNETHLQKVRKVQAGAMLASYAKGDVKAREIQAVCGKMDMRSFGFLFRAAYCVLRCCPCLLKFFYPIYRAIRMLEKNIFGKWAGWTDRRAV